MESLQSADQVLPSHYFLTSKLLKMKKKKISLSLNKEVIDQLDKAQLNHIKGGSDDFLSIWGSNCNNSDPNAHACCTGVATEPGACVSYTTITNSTPGNVCVGCG
jgi:natural product precursor